MVNQVGKQKKILTERKSSSINGQKMETKNNIPVTTKNMKFGNKIKEEIHEALGKFIKCSKDRLNISEIFLSCQDVKSIFEKENFECKSEDSSTLLYIDNSFWKLAARFCIALVKSELVLIDSHLTVTTIAALLDMYTYTLSQEEPVAFFNPLKYLNLLNVIKFGSDLDVLLACESMRNNEVARMKFFTPILRTVLTRNCNHTVKSVNTFWKIIVIAKILKSENKYQEFSNLYVELIEQISIPPEVEQVTENNEIKWFNCSSNLKAIVKSVNVTSGLDFLDSFCKLNKSSLLTKMTFSNEESKEMSDELKEVVNDSFLTFIRHRTKVMGNENEPKKKKHRTGTIRRRLRLRIKRHAEIEAFVAEMYKKISDTKAMDAPADEIKTLVRKLKKQEKTRIFKWSGFPCTKDVIEKKRKSLEQDNNNDCKRIKLDDDVSETSIDKETEQDSSCDSSINGDDIDSDSDLEILEADTPDSNSLSVDESDSEADEASGSDDDIISCDEVNTMFTEEETAISEKKFVEEKKIDQNKKLHKLLNAKLQNIKKCQEEQTSNIVSSSKHINETEPVKNEVSTKVPKKKVTTSVELDFTSKLYNKNIVEKLPEKLDDKTCEIDNEEDLSIVYANIEEDLPVMLKKPSININKESENEIEVKSTNNKNFNVKNKQSLSSNDDMINKLYKPKKKSLEPATSDELTVIYNTAQTTGYQFSKETEFNKHHVEKITTSKTNNEKSSPVLKKRNTLNVSNNSKSTDLDESTSSKLHLELEIESDDEVTEISSKKSSEKPTEGKKSSPTKINKDTISLTNGFDLADSKLASPDKKDNLHIGDEFEVISLSSSETDESNLNTPTIEGSITPTVEESIIPVSTVDESITTPKSKASRKRSSSSEKKQKSSEKKLKSSEKKRKSFAKTISSGLLVDITSPTASDQDDDVFEDSVKDLVNSTKKNVSVEKNKEILSISKKMTQDKQTEIVVKKIEKSQSKLLIDSATKSKLLIDSATKSLFAKSPGNDSKKDKTLITSPKTPLSKKDISVTTQEDISPILNKKSSSTKKRKGNFETKSPKITSPTLSTKSNVSDSSVSSRETVKNTVKSPGIISPPARRITRRTANLIRMSATKKDEIYEETPQKNNRSIKEIITPTPVAPSSAQSKKSSVIAVIEEESSNAVESPVRRSNRRSIASVKKEEETKVVASPVRRSRRTSVSSVIEEENETSPSAVASPVGRPSRKSIATIIIEEEKTTASPVRRTRRTSISSIAEEENITASPVRRNRRTSISSIAEEETVKSTDSPSKKNVKSTIATIVEDEVLVVESPIRRVRKTSTSSITGPPTPIRRSRRLSGLGNVSEEK